MYHLPPPIRGRGTRPLTLSERDQLSGHPPKGTLVGLLPVPEAVALWAGQRVANHPTTAEFARRLTRPLLPPWRPATPDLEAPPLPSDVYFVFFCDRGRRPIAPSFGYVPKSSALEAASQLVAFWQQCESAQALHLPPHVQRRLNQ